MKPLASAVMAVHDGAAYLDEAVESLLAQTAPLLELIVVDDGSTDATPDLLEDWSRRDARVRVVRQPNAGLPRSLNRACAAARGRYLVRLDADDVALPDRVERQVRLLENRPDVALLGGQAIMIDDAGRTIATARYPVDDADIKGALPSGNVFVHSAVVMRAESFRAVGGYRAAFRRCEDYDLWLRLAERYSVANLDEPVVRYRLHPDQMTAGTLDEEATYALVARACADHRQSGRDDPLGGRDRADTELIAALGIGPAAVSRERARGAAWYAKTTARAGYPAAAEDLWSLAEASAREASDRRLVADVRAVRAGVLFEQGHRLAATRVLLRAASSRPGLLVPLAGRMAGAVRRRVARRSPR